MAEAALEGSEPVDLTKHPSGIIPTLQNIVSTVNLDCKLDLKAIALQARNAEYNPKAFCCSYHADKRTKNYCIDICFRKNGLHWSKK
uniref:Uncharacterized protein n=1 Tax=Aegilops tauschii subsp. strangulata TaxID=200361 RepID=A0A453JJ83_AEGTS